MSAADRAVRLVARTLPAPIRARYREEWRADAAASAELGLSAASVAAGAAVFSMTLDRDLPSVSGFSLPEQSRRHARWAVALAGLAALFGAGQLLFSEIGVQGVAIAVVLGLAAVTRLWAAARLTAGLGRTAAALGTTGILIFVAAATIPAVVSDTVPGSRHLPTLALALVVGAAVLGVIVWMRGASRWIVASLATATAVVGTSLTFVPLVGPLLIAAGVVFVGIALQTRRASEESARGARTGVVLSSAVMLVLVAIAAIDALVLSPLRISGGGLPLESVYAGLPQESAAANPVLVWAAASVIAVLAYLVVGLRFASRWGTRYSVLLGIALTALLVMAVGPASFSLFEQLVQSFGRTQSVYPEPRLGLYVQLLARLMLAIAAVGWIAPRALREAPATA